MSSAINTVKEFLGSNHQATTTEVDREVAAPVTQETVQTHQHTTTQEAIDKERHIHHHQHRVQPVAATEHLADQHVTQIAPEVTRERIEKLSPEKEALLAQQQSQIQSSRQAGATIQTGENLGVTESEHVHHHVHEHIQPVIQKDVHEHEVIHNVIPVHEKVHEAPIVHETTTLPTISLDQFKSQTNAGEAVHNHGDVKHSHEFHTGAPKVEDKI
ncbi:hypothetical protein [Phaffia rhodozyma]|uniref:Allergen n=1 Tax=Phaffia rhodozyma TaxID=264483 RepID=A0A0F7SFI5_PHARH|nr:hypothetical protein [Phaffia rhodozyma]